MKKFLLLCSVFFLIWSGMVSATELTGKEVLNKVENAMEADTAHLNLTMRLYNSTGDSRERTLEVFKKEGERKMSLLRFLSPATIEGTSFLALEKDDESDMYLYMPALGSERRIAGSQKNSSFVGSDFSYNDLAIMGGGNYNSDYKSTVLEVKENIYKLKLIPTDEDISYKYVIMWVDSEKWYPTKMEFYDQKSNLQKILKTGPTTEVDGYLTMQNMIIEDLKKGSKTEIIMNRVEYNLALKDRLFTVRNLRR